MDSFKDASSNFKIQVDQLNEMQVQINTLKYSQSSECNSDEKLNSDSKESDILIIDKLKDDVEESDKKIHNLIRDN